MQRFLSLLCAPIKVEYNSVWEQSGGFVQVTIKEPGPAFNATILVDKAWNVPQRVRETIELFESYREVRDESKDCNRI